MITPAAAAIPMPALAPVERDDVGVLFLRSGEVVVVLVADDDVAVDVRDELPVVVVALVVAVDELLVVVLPYPLATLPPIVVVFS